MSDAASPLPDVQAELRDEEGLVALTVARVPLLGAMILSALTAVMWWGGAQSWQLITSSVVAVVVLLGRWWAGRLQPKPIRALLIMVLTCQVIVAAATGGMEGVLFVVFIPVTMLSALILPRREFLGVLAIPVVGVVALAVVSMLGVQVVPDAFRVALPAGRVTYVAVVSVLTLMALMIGSGIGQTLQSHTMRAYREAAVAQAERARSTRERNQHLIGLTGSIAHELKNPLTALQGLSKLMLEGTSVGSKQHERLVVMVDEAQRMGRILEEFLNLSRPLRSLAVAPTQLGELVREVASIHEGLARPREIHLTQTGDDVVVDCDRRKVKQVLVNLVQNALQAAPDRSTVHLAVSRDNGGALVRVDDEGEGLEPSLRTILFEPGVTTKGGGSGLGLTVARSLVEQHGGRLTVEDRVGGGCRAELRLPAKPPLGT